MGGGAAGGGSTAVESIAVWANSDTDSHGRLEVHQRRPQLPPTPTAPAQPLHRQASPSCTPGGGQITTLFASNNNGSPGGANYFDVTVAANPITVTALDINTAATVAFSNVRVYVLPG